MEMDKKLKRETLAEEVVNIAQNRLLVHYRFFDKALFKMQPHFHADICGTDGKTWYYVPERVLARYVADKNSVTHMLLHSLLHNIFCHFFVNNDMRPVWDVACDVMVEDIIYELSSGELSVRRKAELERLKREISPLTAEKVFAVLRHKDESEIMRLAGLFREDDHECWYNSNQRQNRGDEDSAGGSGASGSADMTKNALPMDSAKMRDMAEWSKEWKEIAKRLQSELEHFSNGHDAQTLTMNLAIGNRGRQDYSAFLKKFASSYSERICVNMDEFDYNYYLYGLQRYGNMPLIEPLEYKDVKVIRSFAIIIDTSGSVDRPLLEKFLLKTYECILSEQSFSRKFEVHIIQCDNAVRSDVCIRSTEELQEYIRSLTIRGRGGTDFRPALAYVDELRSKGSMVNLKGVLYFTDGKGIFPARKPNFDVAFVYVGEGAYFVKVPAWGIKVIFTEDDCITVI